jgi:hypothetical protein
MASIRKEFEVSAPASAWLAFKDVGAVHTKLAPGFVTDCRMDGPDARIVTFANGLVARELIVDVDDKAMRLAYSARSDRLVHHNASFQVFDDGPGGCRVVWIADVLPHGAAKMIEAMMDEGIRAMRKTLGEHSAAA